MEKNERKSNFGIRSKLISAIAMLLVATIMVVSSTYAWFTLSTAPEVSGVSTAVGANGALEMLLATWDETANDWKYGTGTVNDLLQPERNKYWGNLVDLSDASYGANKITLYPSVLNLTDGKLDFTAPLQTPEYGADGRVSKLAKGGEFGKYNGKTFMPGDNIYGFRGLGVASGLTERQQAFRAAVSAIATAQYQTQTEARNSLSNNGTHLANIAMVKAVQGNTAKAFNQTEVAAIGSMIDGLKASLKKAEEAYIQAIIAYAYSSLGGTDTEAESLARSVQDAADNAGTELNARLSAVFALLSTNQDIPVNTIKENLKGYSVEYTRAVAAVNDASEEYGKIDKNATELAWNDISPALSKLVNVGGITINGIPADEVNDRTNELIGQVSGGKGINANIPTGGGVYADIADLSGDYTVDIVIDPSKLGVTFAVEINASMTAESTVEPPYFTQVRNTMNSNEPADGDKGTMPLTELYGYVIDLAFKTNAAQSNLLLQSTATDRIYKGNNNEQTMGKGSTMTFKSSSPDFDTKAVKDLMSNIRIVFFDTTADSMAEIYANAKLDVADNAVTVDANGVTAQMYIYKTATKYTYTSDNSTSDSTVYMLDNKYYSDAECKTEVTLSENEIDTLTGATAVEVRDNVITALNQNQEKHISALVYLDGEGLKNEDVAANASTSITGTVNFQFASSAALVPMDYSDLHTIATDNTQGNNTQGE